ncbi:hypothetical protein CR513_04148, partial [Mucuna pruriens]
MLLLQEFDIEIRDKSGVKNLVVDHLSKIEGRIDPLPIRDDFPENGITPWFVNIFNYLVASILPLEASKSYKNKIMSDAKYYCIPNHNIQSVLQFCHSVPVGEHYRLYWIGKKVFDSGFYWPTIFKDAHHTVTTYEQCQRVGVAITPVLISLVHFLFLMVMLIFYLLIMFQNGWRLKPPKLMMLKFGMPKALISD